MINYKKFTLLKTSGEGIFTDKASSSPDKDDISYKIVYLTVNPDNIGKIVVFINPRYYRSKMILVRDKT